MTKNKSRRRVSISKGNKKMGPIHSVSLPACTTCDPSAPCFRDCYAAKIARIYTTARDSYLRNLEILRDNPADFWRQVRADASTQRFFRFNVSGDIPTAEFFADVVATAEQIPTTTFLIFTKRHYFINDFLNAGGTIPANLKVILSNWGGWKCPNPHGLPVCEVIFKGDPIRDGWHLCGGDCSACAVGGVGCWHTRHGDTVAIRKH